MGAQVSFLHTQPHASVCVCVSLNTHSHAHCVCVPLSPCRTMLTKDVKTGAKVDKGTVEVIEMRPPTPELFKAALQVTEEAGLEGTFAKLKKSYMATEVLAMSL